MIGLFVRLKLRLLRNMLRTSSGPGLVAFTILAFIIGASLGVRFSNVSEIDRVIFSPIFGSILVLIWVVGPIIFGNSDETIDTTRLALFPLNTVRLATGLGAASMIGPGPMAAALALGGIASQAPTIASGLLSVLAILATIALATTNSRLLLTVLGSTLRHRRSRDLATLATGLSIGLIGVLTQVLVASGGSISRPRMAAVADIVRLTPLAWPSDALGRASTGELLTPAIQLVATVALLAVIIHVWGRALKRALTEVTEADGAGEMKRSLVNSNGATGPVSPIRAVLQKERRYFARHPRYRLQVISQMTVLLIGGAPFIRAVIDGDPESVLLGCIPGLTAGVTGSNLLGPDGRSLWAEIVAMPSLTPLFRGRSLAFAGLGFAGALLITLATAAWTGGWQFVLPALAAAIGMALTGAGVGSYTSVVVPALYPDDGSPNPFATSSPGSGCSTALFTFTGVAVGLVLVAPILVLLVAARDSVGAGFVLAASAPIYGFAIWWFTTAAAGRRADRKTPELVSLLARAA